MLAVWCIYVWEQLGKPQKLQLIELGPGRGTLMKDLLTAAESFPDFFNAVEIHFIENSERMRELQRQSLRVVIDEKAKTVHTELEKQQLHDAMVKLNDVVKIKDASLKRRFDEATSKVQSELLKEDVEDKDDVVQLMGGGIVKGVSYRGLADSEGLNHTDLKSRVTASTDATTSGSLKQHFDVAWHWSLNQVPSTSPAIILAHEFFDALPVHQFKYTPRGWREILVDIDVGEGAHHFKYVLAPEHTPASKAFAVPMQEGDTRLFHNVGAEADQKSPLLDAQGASDSNIHTPEIINPFAPVSNGINSNVSMNSPNVVEMPFLVDAYGNKISKNDNNESFVEELMSLTVTPTQPKDEKEVNQGGQIKTHIGDSYEVSPPSLLWMEQIALRLKKTSGAALIIDYGDNDTGYFDDHHDINIFAPSVKERITRDLTLQGIKAHNHADILSEPGLVDLSAHVNFGILGAVARRTDNHITMLLTHPPNSKEYHRALEMLLIRPPAENNNIPHEHIHKLDIYPSITQSEFLQKMGISERFNQILQNCQTEEQARNLFEAVNRMVDPAQMGELFKVMCVVSHNSQKPPGWGDL